jgi:hypothetical protein
LESVLKDVGDFGSMAAARVLDDLTLGQWEIALIWSDSRGFLGGLEGSDMATNCRREGYRSQLFPRV